MNWYKKAQGNIIYEGKEGYIAGKYYEEPDYWQITEIVVPPKKRGMGLFKELMKHMPQRARLLAYPLYNMPGPHVSPETLIKMYEKYGFVLKKDKYGNNIMERNL